MAETENKIYLTYLNGTGFVFNANDYMELRMKHRIVGGMFGTCHASAPAERTLPAELTINETRLLTEKGIAVLVSKQQAFSSAPRASDLLAQQQQQDLSISEQTIAQKAGKLRSTKENMSKIIAGRQRLGKSETAEEILQEIRDKFVFNMDHALLDYPCEHPVNHVAEIIKLPPDHSLKYRVFCDLWSQGKYITAGDAFGADFLLYPGDPMQFHASHLIVLLHEPKVNVLELISKVRMGVTVKKLCVFAYFEDEAEGNTAEETTERKIQYQTVEWHGKRAPMESSDDEYSEYSS